MNATPVAVARFTTPIGPFTVLARGDTVLAAGFTDDVERLRNFIHPSLRPAALDGGFSPRVTAAVEAYFAGDVRAIDAIAVEYEGAGFMRQAWGELRRIEPGAPISYGELAKRCDSPRAVRAAGQACARNPITLFVPCHRVVHSTGEPKNYGWGRDKKEWLLAHEGGPRLL
jgi:methylated-DNA-[protein]-cysteine S-methyltransferase